MAIISVFTASSNGNDPKFRDEMHHLGFFLGQSNHHVLWGGGQSGCMGALLNGVVEGKGTMTALMSKAYYSEKIKFPDNVREVVVFDEPEEKLARFLQSDFQIIGPGGFGSLGEMGTAMTKVVDDSYGVDGIVKPLTFLNVNGCWNCMRDQAQSIVEHGFGKTECVQAFRFVDSAEEVLSVIKEGPIKLSRLSHA